MKTIVVTRHPALVEYIHEIGLAGPDTKVIPHAQAAERGATTIYWA